MLAKVQLALAKLLQQGEPVLIGVSGGPDSVALLDVLVQLGYRPHVCHLNHMLRGAESDTDAEFVRQLAGKHGLPATIESRSVALDEDACRQARLAFFERVAAQTGIGKIMLAHNADDQVETFLLRLIRGAGPTGLSGMRPDRQIGQVRLIRPLLEVSRGEVLDYLKAHGLTCREDSSNGNRRFLRNRIRHELLPLLEREYNPGIRDVLRRTADILRAELADDPAAAQRRAIRAWLGEVSFEQVEAIRGLAMGDDVSLPGGVIVYRDYEGLQKGSAPAPVAGQWPVNLAGETVIAELGVRFAVGEAGERFDADALGDGLFVRTWQDGDRFQPLGMTGEKKLQDFFVDEKVPRRQRSRVPLLCAADGRIAWVVGYRIAEPFKVTKRTRQVLALRFEG